MRTLSLQSPLSALIAESLLASQDAWHRYHLVTAGVTTDRVAEIAQILQLSPRTIAEALQIDSHRVNRGSAQIQLLPHHAERVVGLMAIIGSVLAGALPDTVHAEACDDADTAAVGRTLGVWLTSRCAPLHGAPPLHWLDLADGREFVRTLAIQSVGHRVEARRGA